MITASSMDATEKLTGIKCEQQANCSKEVKDAAPWQRSLWSVPSCPWMARLCEPTPISGLEHLAAQTYP